ncbi:MAG: Gldg family protein [Turicibacter sp.]|nr:Gldg family protein [Turicibacter sp.]
MLKKEIFRNKRLRYGAFSSFMAVLGVAVFVLVNLVASQIGWRYDLTADNSFTLSQNTINAIGELGADVSIYSLFPTQGNVFAENIDFMFRQLLDEYAANSNHISVVNRDPLLHPAFVEQFADPNEPINPGSIIVVGQDTHRVIPAADLITTQLDWNTFPPQTRIVSFNIEPQVTNAVNFVVAGEMPVIYHVVGGGEFDLPISLIQEMNMAGYEVRTVNLMIEEVPEDAEMLLITTPTVDWSPDQAERILTFLQNNGRGIFILTPIQIRFERMDEVLAAFGVAVGDFVIIEGSSAHFINSPLTLLPEFVPNEITQTLIERGTRPLFEIVTGIEMLELRRASTIIEPLIATSSQAYGRRDPVIDTIARAPQDVDGPFNIAVSVEDAILLGTQVLNTRLVLIGTDAIIEPAYNAALGGSNWNFLINSLNWLREEPPQLFIPPQIPPAVAPLIMSQAQQSLIALVSVVIMPLVLAIFGLVIWLRRRNA